MAASRAKNEMDTADQVIEEEKQNYITRKEAMKEKKKKKGKNVDESDD